MDLGQAVHRRISVKEQDFSDAASLEHLSSAASTALPRQAMEQHQGPGHESHSVREAEYKGRTIRIETSYHITVDGEPVLGHVMVGNNGRVHYHSIPNQEFASAVDMVKRVIDLLPPAYAGGQGEEDSHADAS
jgi:hypothetical protein